MASSTQDWTHRALVLRQLRPAAGDFDPVAAYLGRLGAGSRRTMRQALTKLADWASEGRCGPHELPWHQLRIQQTDALRSQLIAELAPATANKHLAALRGVLNQCWQQGQMSTEAYRQAIDLRPARGAGAQRSRRLTAQDIERLISACRADSGPSGARDQALLMLLFGANLRRSEAVGLEFDDYDLRTGEFVVGTADSSNRRRFVMNADARSALERWIVIRGKEPGALFNPVNKGGHIELRRLSEQAIYIACRKRAAQAGLPPISPEDLRRADPAVPASHLPALKFAPSTPV